ncbi:O-Antigen ligase [Mycobacterium sp. JS623]|uniref:O-antigen ligase family protein n=1 Tax=Mycobacterium sp. JS623 TaxID=212767 RepID=UPI0002A5953F|nr:O-antigen ligase family protein [Mycobacterium sp. JS623]AGB21773.1 O-Antigen ligase [Mycobacterium sp. JS623]
MTVALLVTSTIAIAIAIWDPRPLLKEADTLIVIWIVALAAWPYIVIYCVAPFFWADAAEAGVLSPALQFIPAAAVSAIALFSALREKQVDISLPAALVGVSIVFAAVAIGASGFSKVINFGLAVSLYAGVILKWRKVTLRSVGVGALISLSLMALATTIGAVANSSAVVAPCRQDKCGLVSEALTSPFAGNGNVLGMATTLLVPFAFAVLPAWRSLIVVAGVGGLQFLAGSRTAMFALAVGVAGLVVISLCRTIRARLVAATLALVVGFAASLRFMFVNYSGSTDSYRGYLWDMATEAIRRAPVFGHGPGYWWQLNDSALFQANYSPHNGWLDLLTAVGAWGVIVIVAGIIVQLLTTARTALPWLIAYYATVLSVGMLESPYVPYYYGILPFTAIMPLMIYEPRESMDPELDENLSIVPSIPVGEKVENKDPSTAAI